MRRVRTISIAIIAFALSAALPAQWLKQPTPGIPRNADGKPNLTAPTPKTPDGMPDLSGLWRMDAGAYGGNVAADVPVADIQPWAVSLYKQRMEDLGKDSMGTLCLPMGPAYVYGGFMLKLLQTPALIAAMYEDLAYRQIFTDGRKLEKEPNPSWMGYSVGHWDGDTLVVESNGFNDRSWLDGGGHPHTEALRLTERYHRRDFGHLEVKVTLEDPAVYAMPWTVTIAGELAADTELIEYVCKENEKDRHHLVGKASDDKKYEVKVPKEVLTSYVGAYEFTMPDDPAVKFTINVTLPGEELLIDFAGKDPMPLISLGNATFSGIGGRAKFVADAGGAVTHMLFEIVEGELKGVRKK